MGVQLYPWQEEALRNWRRAKCRGIIEAVTGSGKTMVGIAAIAQKLGEHDRAYFNPLVVVPTQVLMQQWYERLAGTIPGVRIGLINQDHHDSFALHGICVGVVNSVVRRLDGLFEHVQRSDKYRTMLVADECHHYIEAPVFNRVLQRRFHYTLGLSATVRDDSVPFHVRGLGDVVLSYGFDRALADGIIPEFNVLNCACTFTTKEERKYLDLTQEISDQWVEVMEVHGDRLEDVPDSHLFRQLRCLMDLGDGVKDRTIRRLFNLLFRRAAICYQATNKLQLALQLILLCLSAGKKAMVFFERIDSTEDVQQNMADLVVDQLEKQVAGFRAGWCRVYHSQMKKAERARVMEEFRQPGAKVLISCRSLDEGLDVPEVDCAILAASTQSHRQRVQRIGRALRRHEGKDKALVITLYVEGSGDDNVVADDERNFGPHVPIHQVKERGAMRKAAELLGVRGLKE